MANTFVTSDLVSKLFLARFTASNTFVNLGSRGLEGDFTQKSYKPGDTVSIRKRNRLKAGDGASATVQDITDAREQVTINHQYHTFVDLTSLEEGYELESFVEQVVQPSVDAINAQMNYDIYQAALTQVNYATGNTSADITQSSVFDLAAYMRKLQIPRQNLSLVVSPDQAANLNNSLYNVLNSKFNEDILYEGQVGRLGAFRIFEDEVITPFTAGSLPGTPVLASNVTGGSSTLSLSGLTASQTNVLKAGDIITIANVYAVSPLLYTATNFLMPFVVQANVNSDGSGNATVTISPAIVFDSTSTLQNVNSQPLAGAAIVKVASNTPNLAFHPSGLDIVCPPLPMLKTTECYVDYDPRYNVAVRMAAQADIAESQNLYRIDVLAGFKWHNQYATRLYSAT